MTEVHREVMGEGEFEYTFLEDEIHRLYEEDYRNASIYTIFALIALLISCLGLYGISLYDVRQRYHERAHYQVCISLGQQEKQVAKRSTMYLAEGNFAIALANIVERDAVKTQAGMTFLIQQTLLYAVPLMIVALAGVFAERSGIIRGTA